MLTLCSLSDETPVLTKSAKASVAMMSISIVLVFLLCFGFSWRRRDGRSAGGTHNTAVAPQTKRNKGNS